MVSRLWKVGLAALFFGLLAQPTLAIDNPDAPDLVAGFEARAKPLEDSVDQAAGGGGALPTALNAYSAFLDRELNTAYASLMARLSPALRRDLQQSQRRWLAWRQSELAFIDRQWTREAAGSSASLTRGLYRNALVKQRTLTLLQYLREIPSASAQR